MLQYTEVNENLAWKDPHACDFYYIIIMECYFILNKE